MSAVLIDTNVLVYASDPNDIGRQDKALHVLDYLARTQMGRLSVQCLAEFVSATTRSSQPLYTFAEVYEQVENLQRAFPVFKLTTLIVQEAVRGARDHLLSYYDAQIWAAAKLNQVTLIFSEDFPDGQQLEGVRFVNPFALNFQLDYWV